MSEGVYVPKIGEVAYTDVSVNFTLEEIIINQHDGIYIPQFIEQCFLTGVDVRVLIYGLRLWHSTSFCPGSEGQA